MEDDILHTEGQQTSSLTWNNIHWYSASSFQQSDLAISPSKFDEVTDLLLERPNLNSSHLFRADILYDSDGVLLTPAQKEGQVLPLQTENVKDFPGKTAPAFQDFILQRTVIRRLIPRNPQLDRQLEQSCFIYASPGKEGIELAESVTRLVVYWPHIDSADDMPWYHPPIQALAYLYERPHDTTSLSVHFLPFTQSATSPTTDRLQRTMQSLLVTFIRLAKYNESPHTNCTSANNISLHPSTLKDTVIPQHLVQNTYTRLKQRYATDLITRWVESTPPSKHVFEDLSIAAFLIELWKRLYPPNVPFPGFIDLACGNGVLTYILIKEGYPGSGFDARRRKTWDILDIDTHLTEQLCIPKPLLDTLHTLPEDTPYHDGIFPEGTFIISNHADELTLWTPLLAALSSSPFLAIPCCSHALSGARHRFPPPKSQTPTPELEEQPKSGDLRASKSCSDEKSTYACLTRHLISLSQEIGFSPEATLMRIPSTRNIGVVCRTLPHDEGDGLQEKIEALLERGCVTSGGVEGAAKMWIEHSLKLLAGRGRGKVNLRQHAGAPALTCEGCDL